MKDGKVILKFFTIILISCFSSAYSQNTVIEDSSKKPLIPKYSLTLTFSDYFSMQLITSNFVAVSPGIQIELNRHKVYFGPSLNVLTHLGHIEDDDFYEFSKPMNTFGIKAGYLFSPSKRNRKLQFNLHLGFEKTFMNKNHSNAIFYGTSTIIKISLVELALGYYLNLDLNKISIFQYTGLLGIGLIKADPGAQWRDTAGQYWPLFLQLNAGFGLGYKL